jgi:uncharacterized membrane protein YsdA (DUF1294 family)
VTRFALFTLLGLNVLAFLLFGFDKVRSKRKGRRTSEATLLLFSWLGGFVGGWWGMSVFRHKTRKTSFRVRMVLATLLSPVWLLVWYALVR